jgi:RHS repeat-associated protein
MRNRLLISGAIILTLLIIFSIAGFGQSSIPNQVNPGNATGVQPYNTYGGVRENIGLANGNLNLQVPLLSLPGRNGLNLALVYDSKIWQLHGVYNPTTGDSTYSWDYEERLPWVDSTHLGWRLNLPVLESTIQTLPGPAGISCQGSYIVTLGDGTKHSFENRNLCAQWRTDLNPNQWVPTGNNLFVTDSKDGAYHRLDTTNLATANTPSDIVLHLKDGTAVHFTVSTILSGWDVKQVADRIVDTNGNVISIQKDADGQVIGIADTVGRQVTFNWTTGGPLSSISYYDSNGAQRAIQLTYSPVSVNPSFTLPASSSFANPGSYNLLSSITLPNGRGYTLQYNPFGEVTKITYPTGGYTAYDYGLYTHFWETWANVSSTAADFREVTARKVCKEAGGLCTPESITTYTPTVDGAKSNNQYMQIVDPEGNNTQVQFAFVTSPTSKYFSPRELLRTVYQGQSTPLRTTQTDYDQLDLNGNPTNPSLPIRVTTTLSDTGQVSKVEYDNDTYTLAHYGTTVPIDNVVAKREYDFGSGAPGTLTRTTTSTWLKSSPYTSTPVYIMDRKVSDQILNASGTTVAQSQYEYDSYTEGITASNAVQHDSAFPTTYLTRGNVTATQRWLNPPGSWLTTRNQYDDAGNIVKSTDPRGYSTTLSYADNWGNSACSPSGGYAAAYLTSATNALNQVTYHQYNSCTGTVYSTTDPNGQQTTFSYDLMGRLVQTNLSDGGQTSQAYNESSTPLSVTTTSKINASSNLVTTVQVDGLGRVVQTQLNSDPQGVVFTDTTYDALDRKHTVSNPHHSGGSLTDGITTYGYDALSRVTSLTEPDGSVITTQYPGNQTIATDEAGKVRTSASDALGRLTQVNEDPSGLNYITTYIYDALDDLTTVNQGAQTRSFTYDSLKRLLSATNPESGTVSYTSYDANGNLLSKTDARAITTNYMYDALNRLTNRSYQNDPSSTAAVSYTYDATGVSNSKGRLTQVNSTVSTTNYTGYDALGRVTGSSQTTNQQAYTFAYGYNLMGALTSETYPSGRAITIAYDPAGRVNGVTGTGNKTYTSLINYAPQGAVSSMTMGNNLVESTAFNNRLQPTSIDLGSLATLGYTYGTTNNNGNVQTQTISAPSFGVTQSYSYDALNRLTSVNESGMWSQTYGYDPYGNRTSVTSPAYFPTFAPAPSMNSANNKVADASFSYDAAGNLTQAPVAAGGATQLFGYDAENKLVSFNSGIATYSYDGDGRRVKKVVGSTTTTIYVCDAAGRLVAEYGNAAPSGPGGTEYLTADHLGSTRVVTDASGGVTSRHDYLPFGEAISTGVGGRTAGMGYEQPDGINQKFTAKERDSESGLDNFGARYFGSNVGRFTSADNFLNDTTARDPQSWNLYTYVRNNPLRYVDPTGEKIYVGDLSDQDEQELLKRVNATYGCQSCASVDKSGYLQVDTSGLSKEVLAATDYLTGAINSTSFFAKVQISNNDPNLAFGESRPGATSVEWNGRRINASLIRLDFGDDRWVGGDSAAKETFLNTVFAHEVAHLFPIFQEDPKTTGPTGPVVDTVNRITDVLGQPRRTGYISSPVGGYWLSLPFAKTTVDKHGNTREKAVQIEWLKRNVGGKGVN